MFVPALSVVGVPSAELKNRSFLGAFVMKDSPAKEASKMTAVT
jgi:hypothetical protein